MDRGVSNLPMQPHSLNGRYLSVDQQHAASEFSVTISDTAKLLDVTADEPQVHRRRKSHQERRISDDYSIAADCPDESPKKPNLRQENHRCAPLPRHVHSTEEAHIVQSVHFFFEPYWTKFFKTTVKDIFASKKRGRVDESHISAAWFTSQVTNIPERTVKRMISPDYVPPKTTCYQTGRRGNPLWKTPQFSEAVRRHLYTKNIDTGSGTNYRILWKDAISTLRDMFDDPDLKIPYNTFREACKRILKIRKCAGDKKHPLRESSRTIAKHVTFLREASEISENCPEVYTDEVCFHENPSNKRSLFMGHDKRLKRNSGDGRRIVCLLAMQYLPKDMVCDDGIQCKIIPQSIRFFLDSGEITDYKSVKGTVNAAAFEEWMHDTIPFCPANSVWIFDNASIHSRNVADWLPSKSQARKPELVEYLARFMPEKSVEELQKMYVVELKELAKKFKPEPVFKVDEMLREADMFSVRTPPYMPEYQPLEFVFGDNKRTIYESYDGKFESLKALIKQAVGEITPERLLAYRNHCARLRKQHWADLEQYIFDITSDYSSASDSDDRTNSENSNFD